MEICILCFKKFFFQRENLDKLTNDELLELANNNPEKVYVFSKKEYEHKLNHCIPMDAQVYTYIIQIP